MYVVGIQWGKRGVESPLEGVVTEWAFWLCIKAISLT